MPEWESFILPWPGFEPGFPRPQRGVLTTIRSRLLQLEIKIAAFRWDFNQIRLKFNISFQNLLKQFKVSWKALWRNGSASDSRSEGCVFESRRGQETILHQAQTIRVGRDKNKIDLCQKWDSNPRPPERTATWTQRLRPLGHPDSWQSLARSLEPSD